MIRGVIIEFKDLQRISGYTRQADVVKWAMANGIKYKHSKNGIWTTTDAVNTSLGVNSTHAANDPYDDDMVA